MSSVVSFCADVTFDFVTDTYLIVVPVSINGHGPYRFLLDTGASSTVLSAAVAENLRMRPRRRALLSTAGGKVDITVRLVQTLNVGGAKLEGIEIAVGDLDLMKKLNVDGLLGGDYLRMFRVDIDYDGKNIKIAPRRE
jgi:predicted aspartyl protease